ncbi:MAG: ACP S-malonyltransferase [Chitinophagales bacterium]
MNAYVFPGQGAQFSGMGKEEYNKFDVAKKLIQQANEILGFDIAAIMFDGSEEQLKQTRVTQPAIFIYSTVLSKIAGKTFQPDMVAGHSLGEFSALVANKVLRFEDGLLLVKARAEAMQKACDAEESTMAAVLGLDDEKVEEICNGIEEIVVPANYNCPGQLVISGSIKGIELAKKELEAAGALKVIPLKVDGAFHSPLMEPARKALEAQIRKTTFSNPICPVYQNVDAKAHTDEAEIKENLIAQLTEPVRWSQIIKQMISDGASSFTEVGPGTVLRGLIKKVDRKIPIQNLSF